MAKLFKEEDAKLAVQSFKQTILSLYNQANNTNTVLSKLNTAIEDDDTKQDIIDYLNSKTINVQELNTKRATLKTLVDHIMTTLQDIKDN